MISPAPAATPAVIPAISAVFDPETGRPVRVSGGLPREVFDCTAVAAGRECTFCVLLGGTTCAIAEKDCSGRKIRVKVIRKQPCMLVKREYLSLRNDII